MLQAENSYDCASTSARESSRVSSRLLTLSLGGNRTNGSSSGGSKRVEELRYSRVCYPENGGGEYTFIPQMVLPDGIVHDMGFFILIT